MIREYLIEQLGDKWESTRGVFFSNSMQIATIAFVLYLVYFSLVLFFKSDRETEYPRVFLVTASYIIIRLFGSVVLGVS